MHILFLTDNFFPEVNAPASRTFDHCKIWVQEGHNVTVITCAPNFPTGRVFPGYRNNLWKTENMEGIKVIRVWSFIAANEGFFKRILDYMSFMVSAAVASFFVRKPDVVIGTSPQFFTACAAYVVGFFKRIPFIFELRDIWPESIKAVGAMNDSFVIRVLEKIELFLYRKADLIVSVTHSFKEELIHRGVNSEKIEVVTNGVDTSRFFKMDKDVFLLKELDLQSKFVAGYVGTHGLAHNLETILEAALIAQSYSDDIYFLLLGDGARKSELMSLAKKMALKNVIFLDSVPKNEVARYWSLLDVSIIHLKKINLFTSVIPSKLFECMAMGIPVLHGVLGESAEIVKANDIGIVFEPENAQDLYCGLISIKNDSLRYHQFQENALEISTTFDRIRMGKKFLDCLEKIKD